jgi:hypothetical protein
MYGLEKDDPGVHKINHKITDAHNNLRKSIADDNHDTDF